MSLQKFGGGAKLGNYTPGPCNLNRPVIGAVVVDSEVLDVSQPCSDALFINSTVYPSLFVG